MFLSRVLNKSQGMTLVELLVVIVLLGLTTTLIVQGIGNALSLYSRVQETSQEKFYGSMKREWWRTVVQHSAPNRAFKSPQFLGDRYHLNHLTQMPLTSSPGLIQEIQWSISESRPYSLIYRDNTQEVALELNSSTRPYFIYMNERRQWQAGWPVREDQRELPLAVRLTMQGEELTAFISSQKAQVFYATDGLQ